MRLGIAHHFGWAVAVTASADHHVVDRRRIERSEPLAIEVKEADALDLQRIRFTFARHGFAQLRDLIDALNDLVESSSASSAALQPPPTR